MAPAGIIGDDFDTGVAHAARSDREDGQNEVIGKQPEAEANKERNKNEATEHQLVISSFLRS